MASGLIPELKLPGPYVGPHVGIILNILVVIIMVQYMVLGQGKDGGN
jgi:hypothetical protein